MEQIKIQGVDFHPLKRIHLEKGDVFHALKCTDDGYCGFGEAYFSEIHSGEMKGWKRHNKITLNLIVPVGKIKFIIYDDREESLTKGQFQEIILSPDVNYQRLTVSPGLWMAFIGMAEGTSLLLDIIPEPHDPTEADRLSIHDIDYNFTK